MAAAVISNSLPQSKFSQGNASSNTSTASKADAVVQSVSTNGLSDNNIDNPYFKELQRSLRNAAKKLNSTAKVDAVLADNPGKSLDALVAEKKINPDQKAQALKKPALQANIVQIEEQIAHYKQFAAHYEARLASQKAELDNAHQKELDAFRERAVTEAVKASEKGFGERLLALSKFLCTAAVMRRSGDETSNEARAFEGVLYQVYGGSQEAVASMLKLMDGTEERVPSVEGGDLDITYCKVKQAAEEYTKTTEEVSAESAAGSDPTIANAASTELQDRSLGDDSAPPSDPTATTSHPEQIPPPAQTMVSDAANPIAESTWESNVLGSLSSSGNTDSWVEVPRNPTETGVGLQATTSIVDTGMKHNPTATHISGQVAEDTPVAKEGDGIGQAPQHQRQPSVRGRGGGRGRGRDEFRGRGRGDFRSRGRGRGGRGRGGPNGAPAAAGAQ